MTAERFVLLGLARARSDWFRALGAWSTSAAVPADFTKCVSAEELRAHLAGGRVWSAALLDGGLPATDRDLLHAVREAGVVPIVVEAAGVSREWVSLGAVAVLPATVTREQLLDVLGAHASMVGVQASAADEPGANADHQESLAPVAVLCGAGGTGVSTSAIALAQDLARTEQRPVVLADLCLRAEQAMLHDARDIVPGVQELVDSHRGRSPTADEVHALTYRVVERGYHLLLGLRRARYWTAVRPRSFEVAFASLRRAFGVVVCDVTADFEGEHDSGSLEVEERNVMARTALRQAAVVFVVGTCDTKGVHALVRTLGEITAAEVPEDRIVPVLNRAPRSPRARAALARSVGELSGARSLSTPVFLPRRNVDEALHDGISLPGALAGTLGGAFRATCARASSAHASAPASGLVRPGSLGAWSPQSAEG